MTTMKAAVSKRHLLRQRPSLVALTLDAMREGLRTGLWHDHLPAERDLCERFQVSRPTIRAALAQLQREGCLELTHGQRRRILSAPRSQAPGPWRKVIGLLSPLTLAEMPPFTLCWTDVLRTCLARDGFELDLHVRQACFAAQPAGALQALVANAPAAAWVLLRSTERMQRWFLEQRRPCVLAGSCAPGVMLPSVDVDYRAACRHAAAVLWRKRHRHVALLLPEGTFGGDAEAEAGLREAFQRSHGGQGEVRVFRHDGTREDVTRCLDQALRRPDPVTAVVVARTAHVLTVLTTLLRRGVRVPQDVAVIARDDDRFLEHVTPQVARYRVSPETFARRLARTVLRLTDTGLASAKPIRLMPRFVPGETV